MWTALVLLALAQQGDVKGETQPPLPEEILRRTPPAPVVPAGKARDTLRLAPGLRIDLLVSEPLVQDPVTLDFDADGRWIVVEMRGFMPSLDRRGESEPVGRVVILEDADGDGRPEKKTVFLDGLVMPRAARAVAGGILVAEPPNLWFCPDADGDLKADGKTLVDGHYTPPRANPEHCANGLLPAIDNWIYNADSTWRYRFVGKRWVRGHTRYRGQWGLSQDDDGRLFYNDNTILLRGDLVPCFSAAAHSRLSKSVNLPFTADQTIRPIRPNPGVNRAYRPGILRADGSLAACTSASAPLVWRGDALPEEFRGDVFVCDPAANLVTRLKRDETSARRAYPETEFLASVDERFRPVNLATGPDGALYVVDMYRGIIQHGAYITSTLRGQILARDLERPVNLGRIWRIARADRPPGRTEGLAKASTAELVRSLEHPNGWRRDTAQRLLAGRPEAVPALRDLARSDRDCVARHHALWALESHGAVDPDTLASLAAEPRLRPAAEALRGTAGPLFSPVDGLVAAAERDPAVPEEMLADRELDFLEAVMSSELWDEEAPGRAELLARTARRIVADGKPERVAWLVDLTASQSAFTRWRQKALLAGLSAGVSLPSGPKSFAKLLTSEDAAVRGPALEAFERSRWPGKAEAPAAPPLPELSPDERVRFERGRRQFLASCAGCHGRSGLGHEGAAPPLVDSPFVNGSAGRLIRIVLHGLEGPLRHEGKVYRNLAMPAVLNLESTEVAEILTYLRREWGHRASPVDVDAVRGVKRAEGDREEPWTQEQLLRIP
jgi:mono/diheme cytochrome c family protein/glucose/arabinose dehydrogenase